MREDIKKKKKNQSYLVRLCLVTVLPKCIHIERILYSTMYSSEYITLQCISQKKKKKNYACLYHWRMQIFFNLILILLLIYKPIDSLLKKI